ncbi:cytochrome P450 [Xylaria intraflava]|nr:cytochrome P450 [Xylaria intraflava]
MPKYSTMELFGPVASSGTWIFATLVTYIALLCGYRIFLHPLRHYPGPVLAKISDAYGGYYAGKMSLHVKTRLDHLRYGPVLRLGPNRLVFTSVQAIQDIYLNDKVVKSHLYKHTSVTDGVWHIFNVIDKDAHRTRRKLIGKVVSERSMGIFEPVMMKEIDTFLGILLSNSRSQTPLDMTVQLKRLGIDIVSLLAFGYPISTQTDSTYRFLIDAHIFGNFRSNLFMQFPLMNTIRLYSFLEVFFAKEVRKYFAAIETMIQSRLAEDKNARHDLYSIIADEINPEGEYRRDSEIWAEATFFFPAGGETTSTLLSAALFYLSRYPEAYEKLATEIRSTFQTDEEIKGGPKLASCKYLRACLDETMRISPPASGTLWREWPVHETSGERWVVDGHVIPDGVQVGVNIYTILHEEEFFPEPFTFQPERWLDPTIPPAQRKLMNAAFQPFSIGARGCAGKAMAYLQASLVLAKTLWHFNFQAAPGELGQVGAGKPGLGSGREREMEFQIYDILAATHSGPNLMFQPRGVSCDKLEMVTDTPINH